LQIIRLWLASDNRTAVLVIRRWGELGRLSLVRHQDRNCGIEQDVAGGPTENELPQPALGVGAFNQQIAP
jgi:hypothetical protein